MTIEQAGTADFTPRHCRLCGMVEHGSVACSAVLPLITRHDALNPIEQVIERAKLTDEEIESASSGKGYVNFYNAHWKVEKPNAMTVLSDAATEKAVRELFEGFAQWLIDTGAYILPLVVASTDDMDIRYAGPAINKFRDDTQSLNIEKP